MAYQAIDLGLTAGDGTGDTIRAGGDKLNDNFVEIYTLLGTGSALTSGISATATIVTLISPTISGVATFSAGESVSEPSITTTSNTNTGIFFPATNAVGITAAGTLRATVNSTGLVVVGNVTATGTVEPAGDTASGDNAAIGYTAAEGLILTGQGSTSDITLKNDADGTVFTVPTGTDDILFPDGAKAMFGAGSDLQIFHDGSDSFITDGGTGDLYISASDDLVLRTKGGSETALVANDDGAVELYYDNAVKLATSSAGGTLTGTWETTTALVPDASDGAALGTTALEWSDLFLADGAVINFGDDQEVTITHVADTGLLLSSTDKLMFNDASQFIQGASATVLDIAATDEIELTATLVDVVGNLAVSGTYTGAGLMTTGGNIVIPDAGNIGSASDTDAIAISSGGVATFNQIPIFSAGINVSSGTIAGTLSTAAQGNITSLGTLTTLTVDNIIVNGSNIGHTSDTDSIAIASNGVVTFSQAPVFPDGSINIADLDIDGATDIGASIVDADLFIIDDGGGGTNRKVAASRFKTYIAGEIGSAADNITAGDAAILFTTSAGNITLDAAGDDTDIILKGTDGGADTTFLTISGADAGEATFNAGIVIADAGNIGSASDKDAIAIASDGVVTFSQIPVMPANSIDSDEYIDGSIDTAHIADSQITVAKMAANSIDSDQYVDGSIDLVHMSANSVDSNQYVDGSIDEVHMSANSIDSDSYVDGSIDRAHLAADIIDGTKIADDVINSEHYAAGSIDREHLAADIIDGTKIADDVINSEHYAAGSIDTEHIANANVTLAKMAINSIDSNQYVDGSIDTAHYAADSITEAKMANDAIGSAELKSLSTLLIKNSSGTTLKTLYGAGA
jgi:hypothetical protein